jgi:hypothetical protein
MDNSNSPAPPSAQEKVAKSVATIVLVGTCIFGAMGISIAIIAAAKDKLDEAKSMLQLLFSTILPLFGTWIGTILAYYFSKENLAAANKTVEHLVNSLTSDKKLETTKAKDVMIPLDKLKFQAYPTGTADASLNIKTYFLDFVKTNAIQRVIMLDEKQRAKYVLHQSTIEGFVTEQCLAQQNAANAAAAAAVQPPAKPVTVQDLTFADLKAKGNDRVQAILKDGVKFISQEANLSDAKVLIRNFPACNDVFITKTGSPDEPVIGWITDKTISENSIV